MTKKDEGQGFTFSMHVLDSAHVHFAGATWPTMQVEKKMDAAPTVNPWKRRLVGMMKVDAAERKNVKDDRSIHNARDARADPNQEGDVHNREGIAKMEMERSAERRRNAETRLECVARLDRAMRRWTDHSVIIALWQFSDNWAEAARVAEREKMLERVKARKTKREANRAVLVRCSLVVRLVTNRGNMRRFLMQFARNLTAARKQSRDWAVAERAALIEARGAYRAALIEVSGGLARVVSRRTTRSTVLQFSANWTAAVLLAVEQKEAEQWLREATVSGGLVRALDRKNMGVAVGRFIINWTAAVLHRCSCERNEEETKAKDEKQKWSEEKRTGPGQNEFAAVLSKLYNGTAGQQAAMLRYSKEGITGQRRKKKKKEKKKKATEWAPSAPRRTGSGRLEVRLRRLKTPWEAWESLKKDEFGADKSGAVQGVPKVRCDR
jgi:hypothetical protein